MELLRALTWRAAEQYAAGEDVTTLASMAKLKAGRLARQVTDSCLQVRVVRVCNTALAVPARAQRTHQRHARVQYWGGMGYMSDTPISRAHRDLRLLSIGGGSDEVMLEILCKRLDFIRNPS